jgi:hypothetical protein
MRRPCAAMPRAADGRSWNALRHRWTAASSAVPACHAAPADAPPATATPTIGRLPWLLLRACHQLLLGARVAQSGALAEPHGALSGAAQRNAVGAHGASSVAGARRRSRCAPSPPSQQQQHSCGHDPGAPPTRTAVQ